MRLGERIASRLPRVIAERLRCSMATASAESAPPAHSDGNPFLAARDEFMNAFADLARGKRNWQLIAYALAGLPAPLTPADLPPPAPSRVGPPILPGDRLGPGATPGAAGDPRQPAHRRGALRTPRGHP